MSPIAAHLLIFWFTQLAGITPPVCITAFVASGIAGSNPMKTGFTALEMGCTFYLVPFLFLFTPLIDGALHEKLLTAVITAMAFFMFVAFLENYLNGKVTLPVRILCGLDAICLFFASFTTTSQTVTVIMTAAGVVLGAALWMYQKKRNQGVGGCVKHVCS